MTKQKQNFGRDWTDGELKFPEHCTPKIIHALLFIYNADSKEQSDKRIEYCAKELGDKSMSFIMSILLLPTLMNKMAQSEEYITWNEQKYKKLN
jgi:hypothetical protein